MTDVNRTIALLFPGQGSQSVGMGKDLFENFPLARQTFEEADDALGYKLSQLCFDGPEDQLRLTEITQPAILTVSIAALRVLETRIPKPAFVAGHSLGEYSAHVSAGTFAFADAVRAVRNRGKYMQEAVPVGVGAMAAILGLDLDKGGASFDRNDLCVVRQPKSGSMVFSWRPVAPGGGGQFAAAWKESVERAGTALAEVLLQNLSVKDDQKPGIGAGEPIVFRVQHDGAPKQQNLAANEFAAQKFDREHGFDRGQGCLYARLPLVYRQDGLEVEIAGEGAEKLVKVCPLSALSEDTFSPAADSPQDTCARSATPLVSVVYSGRAFHAGKADVHYTSFDTALQAARDRVKRDEPGGEYEDPDVRVVYRAAPAHCGQSEMYLMYRFDFQPKPASRLQGFPPLVIELPAQELRDKVGNNVKTVEETWDCEP